MYRQGYLTEKVAALEQRVSESAEYSAGEPLLPSSRMGSARKPLHCNPIGSGLPTEHTAIPTGLIVVIV